MYLPAESYCAAAAFVLGYDMACEGGVLTGFREWLALRLGKGFNLAWSALVLHAAFPNAPSPQEALCTHEAEREAIDTLFVLIATFYSEVRDKREGLATLYTKYARINARG